MKEILFLFFGNTSNFISSHFWNLNDEILKKDTTNNLFLHQNIVYDDNLRPRTLIFDFSESIRPYYQTNEKLSHNEIESLKNEFGNENSNIKMFEFSQKESNFISMMNQLNDDNNEGEDNDNYNYKKYSTKNNYEITTDINNDLLESSSEKKYTLNDILKLSDDKLFDYLDFENNVNNWNDYLQPKYSNTILNEIKTVDVETQMRTSYIHGKNFLYPNSGDYAENFEDNFRKQLENCDKLEVLNLNVDYNTFWGGLSLGFLENIHDMVPKVLKVYNGLDYNSSFYNYKNTDFNIEKYINYTFLYSDLYDLESTHILINPFYMYQAPSFIQKVFNYKLNIDLNNNNEYNEDYTNLNKLNKIQNDPIYNYYYASLAALQLQTFYMPLRSSSYGKSAYLNNLFLHNSHLNIIESDLFFNLENVYNNNEDKTNGYLFNFSRNIFHKEFSWKKLIESSYPLIDHNNSIIYGYNDDYYLIGEKYEKQLTKMSKMNFNNEDKFELPICFPRKYFDISNSPYYIKDLSLLQNNRPFEDFCLVYLKNYKNDYKNNNNAINKYLSHIDKEKYFDYKDKAENVFNMIYTYKDFAENILNIYDDSDDEDDIDNY